MFKVLRYIPTTEITAVNYANLLNIRFTLWAMNNPEITFSIL